MVGTPPADAPTLVLLHEGLGSVGLWRDFPAALQAALGFGVFACSRFGYGRSATIDLPRPLSYMHDEARGVLGRVLDDAGIRRCMLVGHSDGGSIAAIYAGEHTIRAWSGSRRSRRISLSRISVWTSIAGIKRDYETGGNCATGWPGITTTSTRRFVAGAAPGSIRLPGVEYHPSGRRHRAAGPAVARRRRCLWHTEQLRVAEYMFSHLFLLPSSLDLLRRRSTHNRERQRLQPVQLLPRRPARPAQYRFFLFSSSNIHANITPSPASKSQKLLQIRRLHHAQGPYPLQQQSHRNRHPGRPVTRPTP